MSTCEFCGKSFKRPSTIISHICEGKRRHLARKERHVTLAFDTFQRFFRDVQKTAKQYTYEDFAKSPYYTAFVKFGSFISNVNPLYPDRFIDYVIRSGKKIDHWAHDDLYDQYVIKLVKTEPVETALERTVNQMITWSADNPPAQWNHYFKYVSLNRGTYDIKDGKISPWIVLNCASGKHLLQQLDDTQLNAISTIMDIPYWINQFKTRPHDLELVKTIIKESQI